MNCLRWGFMKNDIAPAEIPGQERFYDFRPFCF
jgi:hypothetical protein